MEVVILKTKLRIFFQSKIFHDNMRLIHRVSNKPQQESPHNEIKHQTNVNVWKICNISTTLSFTIF